MLRAAFVLILALVGALLALRGPVNALGYYLWIAYFRPEDWIWDVGRTFIEGLKLSFWAGVLAVLSTFLGRTKWVWNGHLTVLFCFAAHAALSAALSAYPDYAWAYCKEFLRAAVITYLIVVLLNEPWKLQGILLVMGLSLGFEGAKQGWLELLRNPGQRNDNTVAFLGDNNGVAVGMLMLVPILDALAKTANKRWLRYLHRFILVGVVYRALSTYSRGGFLAAGVLAVVYWWRSRNKIPVLAGMVLVAGLLLPVMPDAFWTRMESILTFAENQESSALSRLHFWNVARVMAQDNPLFGVGFNAYNPAYDEYDFSYGQYGQGRSVHSSWFGVLAEMGYPGIVFYGLLIALAIRNCHRARKETAGKPGRSALSLYAGAFETSLWIFIVGGTFLPFQYNEMLFHVIGLSIALRILASRDAPGENPQLPPDLAPGERVGIR